MGNPNLRVSNLAEGIEENEKWMKTWPEMGYLGPNERLLEVIDSDLESLKKMGINL